jgi:alpha-mannosidase
VGALQVADLLEKPRRRKRAIDLHGYQVATVLARIDVPKVLAGTSELAPHAEAAQPLFARYWLHNRGPAPVGGLPAVAHLHPASVTVAPGDELVLRLTAASDSSDLTLSGQVEVVCPGLSVAPPLLPFTLRAGANLEADVTLKIPAHTEPGLYPVRAQLGVTGEQVPPAWRQAVEDVCLVTVGAPEHSELVFLVDDPAGIELKAGESGRLVVTVGSHARAELALEAHLISPWGTWEWIGPAALGATLPAEGTAELGFDVTPPAWQQPGQWWALVRVGCAGRLLYSPAVQVTVT